MAPVDRETASLYAVSKSTLASAATVSPACILPTGTAAVGSPFTAEPGETPTNPLIVVGLERVSMLLTVEPAKMLNAPAEPRKTAPGAKAAPVTVSVVLFDLLPVATDEVAVISDEPAVAPFAMPLALMVATPVVPDVQVTELVTSAKVLSENLPVAVNCWFCPLIMV